MNQSDNLFFEAYKHLDKLCGDIFHCNNGISAYITEMENTIQGQYKVSSWMSDYKSLKHIRWVRNQIAHDISGTSYSDEADIEFTESFYDRIMQQKDPLAQLRIVEQEKRTSDKPVIRQQGTDTEINTMKHSNIYRSLWIIAVAGILLLLLWAIVR